MYQNCIGIQSSTSRLVEDTAQGLSETSSRLEDLERSLLGIIDTERKERLAGESSLQTQITSLQQSVQAFETRIDQRVGALDLQSQKFALQIQSEMYLRDEILRKDLSTQIDSAKESLRSLIDKNAEADDEDRREQEIQIAAMGAKLNLLEERQSSFVREVALVYATKSSLEEVRQTTVELKSLLRALDLKVAFTKEEILDTLGERVLEINSRLEQLKENLDSTRGDLEQRVDTRLSLAIDEYRKGLSDLSSRFDQKLDLVENRVLFIAQQENENLREELLLDIRQEAMILTLFLKQAVHSLSSRIDSLEAEIKTVAATDAERADQLRRDLTEARRELNLAIREEHLKREELNASVIRLTAQVDLMKQDLLAQQVLTSSIVKRLDTLTTEFEQEKIKVTNRFSAEREETNRMLTALEEKLEQKIQAVQQKAAELVAGLGLEVEVKFKSVVTDIALLNSRQASFDSQLKGIAESVQSNRAKTLQFSATTSQIRQALLPPLVLSRQFLADVQLEFIKTLAPDERRTEAYWESFKPLTVSCGGDINATFPNAMGMDVFQVLSLEYLNLLLSGVRSGTTADQIFHSFGAGVDEPGFHRDLMLGIIQWPTGSPKADCVSQVRSWARQTLLNTESFSDHRRALANSSELERVITDAYTAVANMGPGSLRMSDLLKNTVADLPNKDVLLADLSAQYIVEWIDLADAEWALQDRVKDLEETSRFLTDQLENQQQVEMKIASLRTDLDSFKASTEVRMKAIENELGSLKTSLRRALDVLISLSDRGGYNDLKAATVWAGEPIEYVPQVIPDWRPQVRMVQHFFSGALSLRNQSDACTGARILEDGGVRGANQFGSWGKCWVNFRAVPLPKWKSEANGLWFRVFGAAEVIDVWIDPDRQREAKHLFKGYPYKRRIDFRNPPPDARLTGRFDRGVFDFSALGMLDYYVERIRTWGGVTISFRPSRVQKFGDQEVITNGPDFHYNIQLFSPLVVDAKKSGPIRLTSVDESKVWFSHDPDHGPVRTGWIRRGDVGLLAIDRNGNGQIDSGAELFGEGTRLRSGLKAADGFVALKEFDENEDGRIDSLDSVYPHLLVWHDFNEDGQSQSEEIKKLGTSESKPHLSLNVQKVLGDLRSNRGNLVDTFSDGDVRLYDVFFMSIR
jgi:hypothetical protein